MQFFRALCPALRASHLRALERERGEADLQRCLERWDRADLSAAPVSPQRERAPSKA